MGLSMNKKDQRANIFVMRVTLFSQSILLGLSLLGQPIY